MYADFHPNTRRFWLDFAVTRDVVPKGTPNYKRCANLGSAQCLSASLPCPPAVNGGQAITGSLHSPSLHIELWAPRFDPWTGELRKTRLDSAPWLPSNGFDSTRSTTQTAPCTTTEQEHP